MYFLAIIQNESIPALYTYDSMNEALASFHQELAYRAEGRTSTKCAILNENLQVIQSEEYNADTDGE